MIVVTISLMIMNRKKFRLEKIASNLSKFRAKNVSEDSKKKNKILRNPLQISTNFNMNKMLLENVQKLTMKPYGHIPFNYSKEIENQHSLRGQLDCN